jgi:SEFIR domain
MIVQQPQRKAPRLFVSYSHDSREHEDRVCALADRLREDGIDTVVDQYDTVPPDGWAMWMEREIQKADFVALVCTPTYLRRVEGREEPGKGRGVLWEAKLIYNHLYAADTAVQRFVPILLEGGDLSDVPWPLRGLAHYRVDTSQGYDDLYRHLTNQPHHEKPVLGKLKALPAIAPQSYASSLEARMQPRPPTSLERRNRQQILKRVRLDWIEGVLNQSLYKVARIELGLEAKADAVEQPLNALVQVPDRAPMPMAPGTPISQIFDAHGGALLISGRAGHR